MSKLIKRSAKECEEIITRLQKKVFAQDRLLCEMRMCLYRTKRDLKETAEEIDGLYLHHLDGSDLLVSKEELFNVLHNTILRKINWRISQVDKPLSKLKEFIGW